MPLKGRSLPGTSARSPATSGRSATGSRRAAADRPGSGQRRGRPKVGERIMAGMRELEDWMASGRPLEERFTVRTVEMPDEAGRYDAAAVRATRERLGASQA